MKAIYSTTSKHGVTCVIRCNGKRHNVQYMAIDDDAKVPDGWHGSVDGAVNPKPKTTKKKASKKVI